MPVNDRSGDMGGLVYDPLAPEQNADPYPMLKALREQQPVHRSEAYGLWLVSRHEDVKQGLNNPALFSSATANSGQSDLCPAAEKILATCPAMPPTLVTADPPVQSNNRRPVQRALSTRRIRQMQPRVHELAAGLIDRFRSVGEVEFVSAFAGPLPVSVVAELIGVPRETHRQFKKWADDIAVGLSANLSQDEQVQIASSTREVEEYLLGIIADRRAEPCDDLVSELLAAARPDGTPFGELDVLSIIHQFVVAGHETTTSTLTGMMLILTTHPRIVDDLLADESTYDGFVEESLRYFSPVQGRYRQATADTAIQGQAVRLGDRLQFHLASANRDGSVFANPDDFDLRRPNVRDHLTFGHGIHYCVGAELARLECKEALKVLLPAMPGVRLRPGFEEGWAKHFHLRGLTSLDLLFDPVS